MDKKLLMDIKYHLEKQGKIDNMLENNALDFNTFNSYFEIAKAHYENDVNQMNNLEIASFSSSSYSDYWLASRDNRNYKPEGSTYYYIIL